ncbi:MAG: sigma-70 family RNA polymerase sigma factor [Planctomycetes bacterium]|nr:sigma-70 family RNA polymerase sigma factor [Planctomycetota bacterium]
MLDVLRHLRKVLLPRADCGGADGILLERFCLARDESAFELLVWRHHRLVLDVCSRVLSDTNDVEDAFQATFLVLACKAGSVRKRGSVSSWLYGVARRVALQASRRNRLHSGIQRRATPSSVDEPADSLVLEELRQGMDEELGRLPEKYRTLVVHCYLEGKTYDEAGKLLGLSMGTISTRLTHARDLLRERLTRRGLAVSAGALAGWLCEQSASAAAPMQLLQATVKAGVLATGGRAALGAAAPASVVTLTKKVVTSMFLAKLKFVAMIAVVLAVCTIGLCGVIYQAIAKHGDCDSAFATATSGQKAATEKTATDQERLQGVWRLLSAKFGGSAFDSGALQLTFAKKSAEYETDTTVLKGDFTLGKSGKYKMMDVNISPKVHRYLYELDGDKLILAQSNGPSARPKDLTSEKGDTSKIVRTFERVAKPKLGSEPPGNEAKMKRARLECGGSLERLQYALIQYIEDHDGEFPPPYTTSKDGTALLSWRVTLLPYLGEKELYEMFHEDEPWDSVHNRKLLSKMPKIYASVGKAPMTEYGTFYQTFVGEGALFEKGKRSRRPMMSSTEPLTRWRLSRRLKPFLGPSLRTLPMIRTRLSHRWSAA